MFDYIVKRTGKKTEDVKLLIFKVADGQKDTQIDSDRRFIEVLNLFIDGLSYVDCQNNSFS